MKELEYYRGQHRAAMNQLEATAQESATLRGKYSDVVNDKQRLDREVQALQKEVSELRCQNQEVLVTDASNTDAMNQHYLSALRKYEAIKDEYDSLRKRYDDLISSHSSAVNKVSLLMFDSCFFFCVFLERGLELIETNQCTNNSNERLNDKRYYYKIKSFDVKCGITMLVVKKLRYD